MATLLLVVIYVAFIGLGLPDSLFGASWSAIYPEFGVGLASASYVTVPVSGCTVISSLFAAKLIARFSTVAITTVSTAMTAIALLGYSVSPNLLCMCVFAVVLGLGAGAIDASLNNYIALYYNAMHMNFLHCFYGIGVVISPYVMSLMLKNATWRQGYYTVFMIQASIALVLILSVPLWRKVRHNGQNTEEETPGVVLSFRQMIATERIRLIWVVCIATNAIEAVLGIWGSSFLVLRHSFEPSAAAGAIMFYYMGLALGRFTSGLVAEKLTPWRTILVCVGITAVATAMIFAPLPSVVVAGMFLAGFGNGPIYPNIMFLAPQNFGKEVSASVIGSQMAVAYGGFMAAPPIFAIIAEKISVCAFPWYILFWLVVMTLFIKMFLRRNKNEKN